MKNIILINALSFSILIACSFGMVSILNGQTTVPNTNTFTLQNVVDVVGGTSLNQAFTNSVDAYFDPTYKGSKNQLYNFRNYKASDLSISSQSATATGSSTADISYDISSTNYNLTSWYIYCYLANYTFVGYINGSASGNYESISQTYTGLSANTSYLFLCYGEDASGNSAANWTNEITTTGCTRPGGLTTITLYSEVNGTSITSSNYCSFNGSACGTCTGSSAQSTWSEGADVYDGTGTDCTKYTDGYYVVWIGSESQNWAGVHVSGGKVNYCYM